MLIFFFNDTATTEIYTLSLHDALPILYGRVGRVVASDGSVVHALWSAGVTPVVHSIGQDEIGRAHV